MMHIRGGVIRTVALKAGVRLLLAVLALRALIPAGYMPDFSAAAGGVFKVVICSASGQKSITLDGIDRNAPSHDQKASHSDQPCAFTGLAAVALTDPTAGPSQFATMTATAVIPPLAVEVPPARAGPPLGSRGPPQLS